MNSEIEKRSSPNDERELERVYTLYDICLRDYFSTFSSYSTATAILLAGVGFVVSAIDSPALVSILAFTGIYLCFQWHISATSMRDQYTHFYVRIVNLEKKLEQNSMLRWRNAAAFARGRDNSLGVQAMNDARYLTWSLRQIGKFYALRGISMPIIYSTVFLGIGIALGLFKSNINAELIAAVISILWFAIGHILVNWEIKSAYRGRYAKRV